MRTAYTKFKNTILKCCYGFNKQSNVVTGTLATAPANDTEEKWATSL